MTTFLRNNAEGATSGTSITTANSADNAAGDALDIATSGTRTYDNAWTHSGTTSWKLEGTSGNTAILGWDRVDSKLAFRSYFRFTGNPSATCNILQARHASGGMASVGMRTDGKLQVTDSAGAYLYTFANALSFLSDYRLELFVEEGTTTSDGKISFAYYLGDNASPVEPASVTTTANTTTNSLASMRWGKLTGIASTQAFWFDDAAVEYGRATFIGPKLGDPVITHVEHKIVEVDTTGSNGTMALTQLSGTTCTITGPTSHVFRIAVPDHADVLRFRLTATADGAPITQDFTVAPDNLTNELVLPVGGTATVLSDWV